MTPRPQPAVPGSAPLTGPSQPADHPDPAVWGGPGAEGTGAEGTGAGRAAVGGIGGGAGVGATDARADPGGLRRFRRLPRSLHPAAWWAYAVGMAAAASQTTNVLVLALMLVAVANVVVMRRGDGPWARSFRLYMLLGAFIVVMRVFYRVVFGGGDGGAVLLRLPEVPLPDWVGGIRLLGPVTADALAYGFTDGLRLATVVVCVGAANSLANPKRLLAAVPGALYEIGSVLVVSVTVFSQLADSVLRVRRARMLRGTGGPGRGMRHRYHLVRAIVVPVLTDALDRSLRLAASMDARGYGRQGQSTPGQRSRTAVLLLAGLVLLAFGAYATVSSALPSWHWYPADDAAWTRLNLGWPFLLAGAALAVAGFADAGRTVRRSRYRPDRWRLPETLVLGCGLAPFVVMQLVLLGPDAAVLVPGVREWPTLTPALVAALVVAVLPAVLTPPPLLSDSPEQLRGGRLS